MNDDDKFWISVWSIVGVVIIALAVTITTYNITTNIIVAQAIKDGGVPIEIKCAFNVGVNNDVICNRLTK